MNKKTIFLLAIFMIIIFSSSGCSSSKAGRADISNNNEVMQALDETVTRTKEEKAAKAPNQDLAEIRAWKYAGDGPAANQSTGQESVKSVDVSARNDISASTDTAEQLSASYQREVVTIQLITEDEMNAIIDKLLSMGYLESKSVSESEFGEALKQYQLDYKLVVSGVLDSPTLTRLNEE